MAKLVINPTSASKKEIPIASRVISIGRDPSNDLVLSDSMVSRRHAILEQRDDIFVLRDNNSSNGTLVNGDKVDAEKTLRDGDLVAIGSSRLLFQLEDSATPPPGSPAVPSSGLEIDPSVSTDDGSKPSGGSGGMIDCPACGKKSQSDDRFCRACGSELQKKTSVNCTACGKNVPLPAEFCGHCGYELPTKDRVHPTLRNDQSELLGTGADAASDSKAPPNRVKPRPKKASPVRSEEPAGFAIRLVAAIVDSMILGIPILVATLTWMAMNGGATGPSSIPPQSAAVISIGFPILCFVYYVFFWALRGATPGKSLLGLTVQDEDGDTPIGLQRAALRMLGYLVSSLIVGLGFVLIAFSEDKRGLHDRIAGTRVMRNL